MDQHHYLGNAYLVGETLRYVTERQGRWLALLGWFSAIAPSRPRVVLTHGENEPREMLAQKIQQQFKLKAQLPALNEVIEL